MTWDRLDECYGAPEVIESSLFEKLDSFPKISKKDNRKLRVLGDLLMELLSAKEDAIFQVCHTWTPLMALAPM